MENKELNRMLIALLIIVAFVAGVVLSVLISNAIDKKTKVSNITKYDEALASTTNKLIYVGRPTCSYCQKFNPILNDLKERYKFDYFYLNTDELSSDELKTQLAKLNVNIETFGTPYLAIVNNNKKIAEQPGLVDKITLFNFLQKYGIIKSDAVLTFDNEKMLQEFDSALASDTNKLVLIGKDSSRMNSIIKSALENFKEQFGLSYVYLNLDEMTPDEQIIYISKVNIIATDIIPYLAIVKKGSKVTNLSNYTSDEDVFVFAKNNGIISSTSKLPLNYINYSEYQTILSSSKKSVVVIAQTGCSYCASAYPILSQISKENNITINYFNMSYFTQEEYNSVNTKISNEATSEWGTPLTLIIKDGKIVAHLNGLVEKNSYVSFFKENKIM